MVREPTGLTMPYQISPGMSHSPFHGTGTHAMSWLPSEIQRQALSFLPVLPLAKVPADSGPGLPPAMPATQVCLITH